MITAIRRIIGSKLGAGIALLFIAIMGLAFAVTDVNNFMSGGGGVSGGNVARVGDREISVNDLRRRIDIAFDGARQQNPTLTREQFLQGDTLNRLLEGMIDVYALEQYGRSVGFSIDDLGVDSVIVNDPNFAGPTGSFSEDAFKAAIRETGYTETEARRLTEIQAVARQIGAPFGTPGRAPNGYTLPYASALLDTRIGQATVIPAVRYQPTGEPTPAQLETFYRSQRLRYTVPERRTLRYAVLDSTAVRTTPTVSDAEIAAEYRAQAEEFAASQSLSLSQVIAPDQATANRIATAARGGQSLATAAQAAGLAAAPVTATTQQGYAAGTNAAVARAVFAAREGALVGPLQVPLGYVVVSVDEVERRAAVSLAQATPQLRTRLLDRKRQEALVDVFNRVQDSLNNGASVQEVATQYGLTVRTTPPILADGRSPAQPTFQPDAMLGRLIEPGFAAGDGDPAQVITLQENASFALLEVTDIADAAPPALRQIRERVVSDWRLAQGARSARDRARAIVRAVDGGTPFAQAAAAQGVGSGVQRLQAQRIQLLQQQRGVSPEIALLFSIAPGEARTLELPNNGGWMVITLTSIQRGNAAGNEQLLGQMAQEGTRQIGQEYSQLMIRVARQRIGVTIDDAAMATLRRELAGGTGVITE